MYPHCNELFLTREKQNSPYLNQGLLECCFFFNSNKKWRKNGDILWFQLFALGGHLFVLCHRTLYMFSYSCHSSSLASILGQQRVNTQPQGQTPPPGPLSWSKTVGSSRSLKQVWLILSKKLYDVHVHI